MSQHPTDLFRTSCGATAPLELTVSGPGSAGGRRHVFEHPFVLVGRHERSCLRLEDDAVSRQHAYVQQLGGRVFCVDLGSRTGVRWGKAPRPAGWLRPGQGVQIGPYTLELAAPARAGEEPGDCGTEDWDPLRDRASDPRCLPRVTVEAGNEVLAHLSLNRALVLVGSSPDCRIRLRDSRVWRYHCSLLRTPQGVWLINLLPGADACLNGQPLRWALVKDGDRLQVGPYVLRVWYPEARTETSPPGLAAIPAGTPVRTAEETSESGQPSHEGGGPEPAATEASALVAALRAELDQAGERQRDAEILRQQLADTQAEGDRLRERAGAREAQVAGMALLPARLEAAEAEERDLEVVRGERDHWQAEAHDLQAQLASDAADREQLARLVADLGAACAERDRLRAEQQSSRDSAEQATARVADLERALTEAAAGHETALAAAGERQRDAEALRQQLADRGADCDRLRDQARALEAQLVETASLQERLETADAGARELEVVRGERNRWQAEAQELQAKLASAASDREQFGRLAADLDAANAERDRLRAEQQTSRDSAEQATARVSDLERALTEAAAAHETALAAARAGWESERQVPEAHPERERPTDDAAVQAAIRDVQAQAAADLGEWQQRLEAAEQQLVWERGLSQLQCDQLRQQVGSLQAERDRLVVRLAEVELRLRAAEARTPEDAGRAAELQLQRQQAARDQVFVQLSTPRQ